MRSSIQARLVSGYIAVVILLAVAWATTAISAAMLRANYTHTVNTVDALSTMVLQGSKLRDDEETGLRGYLLTGKREFLQPYVAAQRAVPSLRRRVLTLAAGDPRLTALLHARAQTIQAWEQWATHVLHHAVPTSYRTAAFIAEQQQGKLIFDRYRDATADIIHYLDTRRQHDLQHKPGHARRHGQAARRYLYRRSRSDAPDRLAHHPRGDTAARTPGRRRGRHRTRRLEPTRQRRWDTRVRPPGREHGMDAPPTQ